MNDEMYGGPISPESSFGQGAQSAMDQLDQLLRLRQAKRAAAIAEQAAAYEGGDSRNEMPPWRQQRAQDFVFRDRNEPEEYRSSRPYINEAMIENTPMPEEYRRLLRNIWNSKKYSEREGIREYIVDAIMSNISPQRPDRDPALLPQPTRGNMYGRFPGRE